MFVFLDLIPAWGLTYHLDLKPISSLQRCLMPGLSAFSPLALRVGKNLGYLFYILMSAIYHNLFLLLSISHCPGGSWVASFLQQCCLSPVLCPLWAAGAVAELGGSWGGSMGSDAPLPLYLDGRRHSWDLFLLLLSPSTPCGSS